MTRLLFSAMVILFCLWAVRAQADACVEKVPYDGLIFDAAAFVDADEEEMTGALDEALTYKVEKIVFFKQGPDDQKPLLLEEQFPDLVVRAQAPWSGAPAVKAIVLNDEIQSKEDIEAHLVNATHQASILLGKGQLSVAEMEELLNRYPELWLGIGIVEIEALNKSCLTGQLADLYDRFRRRLLFTSGAGHTIWSQYKWTIRAFKRLLAQLPAEEQTALAFGNAQKLYQMLVTAP